MNSNSKQLVGNLDDEIAKIQHTSRLWVFENGYPGLKYLQPDREIKGEETRMVNLTLTKLTSLT